MTTVRYFDWQKRVIKQCEDLMLERERLDLFISRDIFQLCSEAEQRLLLKQSILMELMIETLRSRIYLFQLPPLDKTSDPLEQELATVQMMVIDKREAAKRMLTDGSPVPEDESHTVLREDGQQTAYVVLTPAERMKGFINPVRREYRHKKCNSVTTMGQSLAETYARDPWFYSGTFCVACAGHFPLAEFVWDRDDESLDPMLWSDEMYQRVKSAKEMRG